MTYILLVILSLLWGLSFLGTKILLEVMLPAEILAVRWTLAFVTFTILILLKVVKVDFKKKPIKLLLIAAAMQPCAYSILETWGVNLTTSSESSIFIAMVPLVVVLQERIFLKKKVSKLVMCAMMISFTGVLITVVFAPGFSTGSKLIGYLALIAAITVGSAYSVYSNKFNKSFSPVEITYALAIAGMIFFNTLSLADGNGFSAYQRMFTDWETAAALVFLGVGCSCVAYLIFNYNLSRLPAAIVAVLQTNAITVVGVVAGIIFGGDPWGLYTVIGLAMAITGICISSTEDMKKSKLEKAK